MLLETRNLGKRYGAGIALDDVSTGIDRGTTVGLVGKNGAGKTTLLSIIAGLVRADSGAVSLDRQRDGSPGTLGYQPQETCFRSRIPILRQLRHLQRLQQATDADLERLLAGMDIRDCAARPVEQLSYGQAKRLNIVQAFLGMRDLILLDEPTAGLDPVAAGTVREMILSNRGHSTFLISSHNLYELQDLCQRVLILDQGRLINDIHLEAAAGTDSILRLQLDRAPDNELVTQLSRLAETTQLDVDRHDSRKLTLQFASSEPDRLQLAIQSLINERGFSILRLNRGRTLSDDMAGLK